MKKAMSQSVVVILISGISILALIFLIVSLSSYRNLSKQLNEANEARFQLTYNANRFMNGSAYLTNEVRAFSATGHQEHYDNYWNEVNTLKNRDKGVAAMQELGITPAEQGIIDKMSSISNNLIPLEEEAMNHVKNGKIEEALAYVYGVEYNTAIGEINALKQQLLDTLDSRTLLQVEALSRKAGITKDLMSLAAVLVVILLLINIFYTRRRVLRPVIAVRDQMGEIAQGQLSAEFQLQPDTSEVGMLVGSIHETKRKLKKYIKDIDDILSQMAQGNMDLTVSSDFVGEFVPIQNAMRQILDALNNALSRINTTAGQVSEASKKMASGAQVLSDGSVQQASAVEQLSASIKEISDKVTLTSQDADDAQRFAADASAKLMFADEKMSELTVAIKDISESSSQIAGIIKTIEDISFQTNILALNAAVEAARAGSAGKGFAVVAEEVRNLANKSAESAQSITDLIEGSVKLVHYGTSLSEDTTQALAGVVVGAKKVTDLVDRIADSALMQSQSLKQLTLGMDQIAEVVQTNATTAETSASSANELYNQAEELKVSVQRFRLRR